MAKTERTNSGMYDETSKIRIGAFTISEMKDPPDGFVWIEDEVGGDGMSASKESIEKVLREWYDKNF